ncbi:MAG: hypothetical protein ACUVWO_01360 [Thermodesulfobacteriota bacterium]
MSRIFEALGNLETKRQMQIEKDGPPAHELGESVPADEKTVSLSPLFLVETLREIKKGVCSIYKIGLLSTERPDDHETREHSQMTMAKTYDQIISTLDMLSGFINVTSPIVKRNTIHSILEEILETNEKKTHAKEIELKKTFAEDLPETILHDEQLRFILNSVLQYAILSTPPGGHIEIVTRPMGGQNEEDLRSLDPLKSRGSEVSISSSGFKDPLSQPHEAAQAPQIQRDSTSQFILRLIREMTRRHRESIDFNLEVVKSEIRISLKFPAERRRLAYYRPVTL